MMSSVRYLDSGKRITDLSGLCKGGAVRIVSAHDLLMLFQQCSWNPQARPSSTMPWPDLARAGRALKSRERVPKSHAASVGSSNPARKTARHTHRGGPCNLARRHAEFLDVRTICPRVGSGIVSGISSGCDRQSHIFLP